MPTPLETALAIHGKDAACVACVGNHCKDLAQACAGDESCRQDAACRVGCASNPDCERDCKLAQSKTDRPTAPLEDCIIEGCVEECRVGEQFDCVGRFGRPLPDAKEKIVEIWQPRSNLDGAAIPEGVRARVCGAHDLECAMPQFETFSDADGTLRIEWPAPRTEFGRPVPFEGYLELVDANHDPQRILPQLVVTNVPQRSNSAQWPNEVGVNEP